MPTARSAYGFPNGSDEERVVIGCHFDANFGTCLARKSNAVLDCAHPEEASA
jgi:hypothetical protein